MHLVEDIFCQWLFHKHPPNITGCCSYYVILHKNQPPLTMVRSCLSGETRSVEPDRLFSSSDVLLSDNMEPRDSRPVGGFPILAGSPPVCVNRVM